MARARALLAPLLVLAACNQPAGVRAAYTVQPPKAYQGDVAGFVRFEDPAKVTAYCLKTGGQADSVACTVPAALFMELPNPCAPAYSGERYALIACHEKGHLSGWPANHPQT